MANHPPSLCTRYDRHMKVLLLLRDIDREHTEMGDTCRKVQCSPKGVRSRYGIAPSLYSTHSSKALTDGVNPLHAVQDALLLH